MQHSENTFSSRHGQQIYSQCWQPEGDTRACVLIVHGLAEHSARYATLASHFTARGYAVCALDLPGHGRSEGTRTFIPRFSEHLDTVEDLLQQVQEQFAGKPVFLLGHSMGGLISTAYLLRNQQAFAGLVLSGVAILTPMQPPGWQMMVIRLLSALLPKLGALQLDANGVSRDPAVVADYISDPLNYGGKVCARTVAELFATMEEVKDNAQSIKLPMLILHGGEDSMAAPEGSTLLHERAGSADKTLHIYPGLYHEIFNEPEQLDIFQEVLDWLDAH